MDCHELRESGPTTAAKLIGRDATRLAVGPTEPSADSRFRLPRTTGRWSLPPSQPHTLCVGTRFCIATGITPRSMNDVLRADTGTIALAFLTRPALAIGLATFRSPGPELRPWPAELSPASGRSDSAKAGGRSCTPAGAGTAEANFENSSTGPMDSAFVPAQASRGANGRRELAARSHVSVQAAMRELFARYGPSAWPTTGGGRSSTPLLLLRCSRAVLGSWTSAAAMADCRPSDRAWL